MKNQIKVIKKLLSDYEGRKKSIEKKKAQQMKKTKNAKQLVIKQN